MKKAKDRSVRVGQALTAIEQLHVDLHWQALAAPNDRDFPGGPALNMLGPAADAAKWESQYEKAEAAVWDSDQPWATFSDYANDQVAAEDHPLFVIGGWAAKIREARKQPTGLTPTLSRASDYIRSSIPWLFSKTEDGKPVYPEADVLVRDLNAVQASMEAVLKAGTRHDTSASACFNEVDDEGGVCGGQLVRYTLKRDGCPHEVLRKQVAEWAARPPAEGEKAEEQHPGVTMEFLRAQFPKAFEDHDRKHCDLGGRDDVYKCSDCHRRYDEAGYWLAVKQHHERLAG